MAKLVVDEDMPRSTGLLLQELGHEVLDVRDRGLRGAEDERVYRFAQEEQAALITGDIGFGNILKFPTGEHFGVVVARFPSTFSNQEMNRQLGSALADLSEQDLRGKLVVVEPGRVRVRKQ